MATQTTGTLWGQTAPDTSLTATTLATYNKQLLTRALPVLLHDKFGKRKSLKKRSGKSMIFRRYETLGTDTTPLTEGVTPSGTDITYTNYTATIVQYGNYATISDMVDMVHYDDVIGETTELLGEQMGETLDVVYREVLNATTSVLYSDDSETNDLGASRAAVDLGITQSLLDAAIETLEAVNAKKFTKMISPTDNVSTFPVAPCYWAIIHPRAVTGLYRTATLTLGEEFTPVERYSSQMQVMPSEVGKYRNIRFVASTNAKVFEDEGASSADVYSTCVFGRDAYGIIPLDGGNSRTIIHRAGSNTDPLNQRNTVGWKAATTCIVLQPTWMVRMEHTAS